MMGDGRREGVHIGAGEVILFFDGARSIASTLSIYLIHRVALVFLRSIK